MPRLWELAALGLALVFVGVILTQPGMTPGDRLAALAALTGAVLLVGRLPRRRGD